MHSNNQTPRRTCAKKGQLVTGILLIISSSLTIIFGIVAVSLPTLYYAYGGNPLWTGAIILSTGVLCTYSSKGTRKCHTVSAFVMSIISIVFAVDQIFWMSVSAASENYSNDHCNYYNSYWGYYYHECGPEIAIDSVLIVLGVFELGFAIAAICVLSMDICCGTQNQPMMPVVYQAGQPVVMQGGYVQSMAPVYPPQTHIVTQPGQVYLQQPQYPVVQVQSPIGQIQQYPPGGQPVQQHPHGGQPQQQQCPPGGQPQQQCPPGGQPTQEAPPAEQQFQFNPPAYNN